MSRTKKRKAPKGQRPGVVKKIETEFLTAALPRKPLVRLVAQRLWAEAEILDIMQLEASDDLDVKVTFDEWVEAGYITRVGDDAYVLGPDLPTE